MKKLIPIIIVLAAVFAAGKYWRGGSKDRSVDKSVDKKRQTTAVVEKTRISFSISVAGEITPAEQVSVRPEVPGKISELPVDIGDLVKLGDLLFSLDDDELQIEFKTRETEIASAKLQLEQARQNLDVSDLEIEIESRQTALIRAKLETRKANENFLRHEILFKDELVSKEAYGTSKTNHELAKNAIASAERNLDLARERFTKRKEQAQTDHELAKNSVLKTERSLELAKDRLSKTRIVAPFDCTVLTRPVSVGQAVSGSGGFNSGTEVLTIADLNEMIINAHVNQADMIRLSKGLQVDVQVEAVIGLKVEGKVERIAPQATIKNGIKGFEARILLTEIDPRVQPGMTAKITIPVVSADNALAVPLAAVFTEQAGRHVFVVDGDVFERRPVKIGVSDYKFAEVLSGLKPGDVVALEPPGEEAVIREPSGPKKDS
jgi:multidrug efflux pump subunit AcrA (membrane-fusion protein)